MIGWAPAGGQRVRVGIIGAGAMGLSLAAMLGRKTDVTLVSRESEQRALIEQDGAIAFGLLESSSSVRVVGSIAELDTPVAVLFVATKTTAIESVAAELSPVLDRLSGPSGLPYIISFQNGIEPGSTLASRLHHMRILRMVLNYGGVRAADNTAKITMNNAPHFIGGPDTNHAHAAESIASMLSDCGLETQAVDNIEPYVWRKGILNSSMNPVAAITDSSIGGVLESPARSIVESLMREGLRVAEMEGIRLGAAAEQKMWDVLDSARAHTPSMVSDIRLGRQSEVGQLNRQVVCHGDHVGVPVPTHKAITSLIDAFDWRVFQREGQSIGSS